MGSSYKDHDGYRRGYSTRGRSGRDPVESSGWYDLSKEDVFRRFDLFIPQVITRIRRARKGPISVLDVGCGSGLLYEWFSTSFPGLDIRYHGVDPSAHRLKIAREHTRLPAKRLREGYAGKNGPFKGEFFDVVIASSVAGDLTTEDSREPNYSLVSEFACDLLHHVKQDRGLCVADFWWRSWWQNDGPEEGSPVVYTDARKVVKTINSCIDYDEDGSEFGMSEVICEPPVFFDFPDPDGDLLKMTQKLFSLTFYLAKL